MNAQELGYRLNYLEKQLNDKDCSIGKLQDEINALEGEVSAKEMELDDLKGDADGIKERIAELENDIEKIRIEVQEIDDKFMNKEIALERTKNESERGGAMGGPEPVVAGEGQNLRDHQATSSRSQ